jgi:hypothetical protein
VRVFLEEDMESRTEIIPVALEGGELIQIQATMLGGKENVGAVKGGFTLEGVTTTIEKLSAALAKTVEKVKPNKASIEFGIEIATKEGQLTALLVQGSATANLTIKLEWEKKPPEKPGA